MLKRTITGVGIVAVVYLVLYFASVPFVMQLAVSLLTVGAVSELCKATGIGKSRGFVMTAILLGVVFVLFSVPAYDSLMCVVFPVAVILFVWMMTQLNRLQFNRPAKGIMLIFVVVLLLKAIGELARIPQGTYYLTLAVTLCFVTDVGAYLVGCGIGRHKLIPSVSPNKTVEGAIGGIVFAVIGMIACARVLEQFTGLTVNYTVMLIYSVLAGIVAEFGDLAMSCVKRIAGIKDFGTVFPGHGGVLDRFDSHLFVVAFTLVFCALTGGYL